MKCPIQIFNYSVRNNANGEVDIHIDGDIVDAQTQQILKEWFGDTTSTSFKSFRDQLNAVEASVYNVYINSGGGIVTDAMAIHDLLKEIQSKGKTVNTRGRGVIGSAATYILMAGNNAEMSQNSWFMIHNVSGAVWGDVNIVESYANTLRKFNNASRDFYASATGMRKEDVTKMMDNETWMTATEAKDKGFIKQITGEVAFSQTIKPENWQYSNMAVLNAYNSAVKPVPANDTHNFIQNQFDQMKKFFTDIVNAIRGVKPSDDSKVNITDQIADAVSAPFEKLGDEIDATITSRVNEVVSSETVNNAIGVQVTTAVAAGLDFTKEGPLKTAFDTAVSNAVAVAMDFTKPGPTKTAFDAAVKIAVENATGELQKDVTKLIGVQQTTRENVDAPAPVGTFS